MNFSGLKCLVAAVKNTMNIKLMNLPRMYVISFECPLNNDNSVDCLSFLFH